MNDECRCAKFRFRALDRSVVQKTLRDVAAAEKLQAIDEAAFDALVDLTDGSLIDPSPLVACLQFVTQFTYPLHLHVYPLPPPLRMHSGCTQDAPP